MRTIAMPKVLVQISLAYQESPSVLGGGGREGFGLFSLLLGPAEVLSVLSAIVRPQRDGRGQFCESEQD